MSKLTKSQKQKIHALFIKRWQTILEEDDKTDGHYEDIAKAMEHGGVEDNDSPELVYVSKLLAHTVAWLGRAPVLP